MRVLPARGAKVVLSERFHYSPEVLRSHRLPRGEAHAAVALPTLVILAPYQDKALKVKPGESFKEDKNRAWKHVTSKESEIGVGW